MGVQATCRTCGAPIRWVETWTGKRMPLDPDPHPDGNVIVDDEGVATVVAGLWRDACVMEHTPMFRSHFVTCPDAAEHRRSAA